MSHALMAGFEGLEGFGRVDGFEGVGGFDGDGSAQTWQHAHQELLALAAKRARLDLVEGRWLLRAFRAGVHRELGYGSFCEYAQRLFGYSTRLTQERLRVAEALEGLPQTACELENARISFSAVRELTRVAVPSSERAWLEAAHGRTVREVEALVSGLRPGSRPGDVPDAGVKRHVLRFDVSGETLATFREAMTEVRRAAGEALDDDAAILQLCRGVLAGARDEGRSSYQVALTVCQRCRAGKQQGRGELVAVDPQVAEMAECDGQMVGHVAGRDAHVSGTERHGRARRDIVQVEASGQCDGAHVGTERTIRATQTIPPALRRLVLRRDGGRCQVPGCRHATFVDVHHVRLRSEGGTNTLENLVTLCGAHHRAIHAGRLLCAGTPSGGLTFMHADGTPYGGSPALAGAELRAKTFRALVQMGFRESEAKEALMKIPANRSQSDGVEGESAATERLLRAALRELAPTRH